MFWNFLFIFFILSDFLDYCQIIETFLRSDFSMNKMTWFLCFFNKTTDKILLSSALNWRFSLNPRFPVWSISKKCSQMSTQHLLPLQSSTPTDTMIPCIPARDAVDISVDEASQRLEVRKKANYFLFKFHLISKKALRCFLPMNVCKHFYSTINPLTNNRPRSVRISFKGSNQVIFL